MPRIVDLVESGYRGERSREGWTTEADLLDGQRTDSVEVQAILTASDDALVVAESDGDLVGCCHVKKLDEAAAYFGMFAVSPQQQGRGLGKQLMAEVESYAILEWHSTLMSIQVIEQRAELIAWYERHGYFRTGETAPFPYDNKGAGEPKRDDLRFVLLDKVLQPVTA